MEKEIHIPAREWTDLRLLAPFVEHIEFRIYNDDNNTVRIATQEAQPIARDAGIPTYVKHFTNISEHTGAWAYSLKDTALILQWDSYNIELSKVELVGGEIALISGKLDQLIKTQQGLLRLLEAAFEDSLSSSDIGDFENG